MGVVASSILLLLLLLWLNITTTKRASLSLVPSENEHIKREFGNFSLFFRPPEEEEEEEEGRGSGEGGIVWSLL